MSPLQRLLRLGYGVEDPPVPSGPCVPVTFAGGVVYVAGQIPVRGGSLLATGTVDRQVDVDLAARCARQCAANALAHLYAYRGTLDGLRMVRMTVYVATSPGFGGHSTVANAASDLLLAVFGEAGRHSRTAVGVAGLPKNSPVELDVVAALGDA